ncbi:hypothetical protein [Hydrogenophaga sp.]|uniref:hypothetical protein n=1 Tax=Hydrogenophaga sp. TaxID=1904254 RepID=UPI00262D9A31|nr:hypothetical protein [Hydrogenophaga sp.]MDM7951049.1 hypothetical protein [Hydrogenophaga sp.]
MKIFFPISLLIGMLFLQSSISSGIPWIIRSFLGVVCFFALIVWFFYSKKKKGSDPALMLNDMDDE